MGRPNLTAVRTDEILAAFERCIAKFGLAESSLERVAEEAGVKRSILRHYIGNREDLLVALAQRVVQKYEHGFRTFLEQTSHTDRIGQLLDYFFPDKSWESTDDVLVVEALIAAGEKQPEIRQLMLRYIDKLVSDLSKQLRQAFPDAKRQRCWSVAYGIISICFNQESLSPMKLPPKYSRSARYCAEVLVCSLETQ